MRIPVKSRVGNIILAILGALYAVSATALLVFAIVQTWQAMSLIDLAVAALLIASPNP